MGAIIWLIWANPARVPFWDEWETVNLVRKFSRGALRWSDFWRFHNEHRIVIPRIIDLILIEATRWNRQIEMTFDLALVVGTAIILYHVLARSDLSFTWRISVALAASMFLFSLSQSADWLQPFQLQFFVAIFGVMCCMLGLSRIGDARWFAFAIVGALIASFSSLQGLVAWIAFFPGVWMAGYRKAVIWAAAAAAVIVPYSTGFHETTPGHASMSVIVHYALAYLGAPVGFPSRHWSQLAALGSIGMMIVAGVVIMRMAGGVRRLLVWGELALFALGCMAITDLGRSSFFGVDEAMASRYHAFSALWWIALLVICASAIAKIASRGSGVWPSFRRASLVVGAGAAILVGIGLAHANVIGFQRGVVALAEQVQNENCIVQYAIATDACLKTYGPTASVPRGGAPFLASQHLAIFAGRHSPPRAGKS